MINDLQWIIPTFISSIAAIFSFLTFKRNRRFENENHLYRIKMESYSKILEELTILVNRTQDHLNHFKNYTADPAFAINNDINSLADDIDKIIFKFDENISKNSLVISKDILNKLNHLSIMLFSTEIPSAFSKKEALKLFDDHVSQLIVMSNDINEIMRDELNIDQLNVALYRRIRN